MGDKPKDKSKDGVSATLVACGTQTDPSSRSISAAIIADNLAGGAKGAAAITNNTRGITESVGSCVANYYDDKKPSAWESMVKMASDFKAAAMNVKTEDVKMAGHDMVLGAVSTVTAGTPEKLQARPAQINAAVNGP